MARLMTLAARRLKPTNAVADRILGWKSDPSSDGESVPLRFAGALHALRLEGLALTDAYPPATADDETLWSSVESAMNAQSTRILDWLESPPQTNEVARSAAILPALAVLARRHDIPFDLYELGASAGLNLRADHYLLQHPAGVLGESESPVRLQPDWTGGPPPMSLPTIGRREGVDLRPIRPETAKGRLRLLAYLWPDQPERLARTDSAIEIARSVPAELTAGDAGDWLTAKLKEPPTDRLSVVFHTVAWQYFPPKTRETAKMALDHAGRIAPLARISMEADGGRGARLDLTTWPERRTETLARVDFHGRWIDWQG